jgi:hypothetical protein
MITTLATSQNWRQKKQKKKKKHQLTVHQTHWAFCAILDVFQSKFCFGSCVKTLIWTCSLKAQVMWWTWFSWRLWGCSCSHPPTSHHFFKMITQSLSHKSQGMLQSDMAFAWGWLPTPIQRQQESLVLKDESTLGVIRVSEMAPNPFSLFIQVVLWSHNWSIVAELSSVYLILTINQL